MVTASNDISVVVIGDNGDEPYAYTGIPASSPSGIGKGTTLYAPNTLNNYYGWYTDLYVQNTTPYATNLTVQYYYDNGNSAGTVTRSLPAWGQVSNIARGPWSGSAVLSAGQPIAATLIHWQPGLYMAYPLARSYATVGFMPGLYRQYYGWNSAYQTT
ncbi:MAG: hypothetical protein ACUVWR_12630, partial [Anaerolineae bacterium]